LGIQTPAEHQLPPLQSLSPKQLPRQEPWPHAKAPHAWV